MNTDTQSTTDSETTTRGKYDREQIAADLDAGMSVAEISEKHGCSRSLVQGIRRKKENGGVAPSRNAVRAAALRKKATQFTTDFELLSKWQKNDAEDGPVGDLIATLEGVIEGLTTAADLYDELPESVMATKRTGGRVELAEGMIVRVKAKHADDYKGVTSSPDHLKVVGARDAHVLVEDDDGARLFVARRDLEVRQDG